MKKKTNLYLNYYKVVFKMNKEVIYNLSDIYYSTIYQLFINDDEDSVKDISFKLNALFNYVEPKDFLIELMIQRSALNVKHLEYMIDNDLIKLEDIQYVNDLLSKGNLKVKVFKNRDEFSKEKLLSETYYFNKENFGNSFEENILEQLSICEEGIKDVDMNDLSKEDIIKFFNLKQSCSKVMKTIYEIKEILNSEKTVKNSEKYQDRVAEEDKNVLSSDEWKETIDKKEKEIEEKESELIEKINQSSIMIKNNKNVISDYNVYGHYGLPTSKFETVDEFKHYIRSAFLYNVVEPRGEQNVKSSFELAKSSNNGFNFSRHLYNYVNKDNLCNYEFDENHNYYYGTFMSKISLDVNAKGNSKNNIGTNVFVIDIDVQKLVKKSQIKKFSGKRYEEKDNMLSYLADVLISRINDMFDFEVCPIVIATGHGLQLVYIFAKTLFDLSKDKKMLKPLMDLTKVTLHNLDVCLKEAIKSDDKLAKCFKASFLKKHGGLIDFNAAGKMNQLMRMPETKNFKDGEIEESHILIFNSKNEEYNPELIHDGRNDLTIFDFMKILAEKLKGYQKEYVEFKAAKKEEEQNDENNENVINFYEEDKEFLTVLNKEIQNKTKNEIKENKLKTKQVKNALSLTEKNQKKVRKINTYSKYIELLNDKKYKGILLGRLFGNTIDEENKQILKSNTEYFSEVKTLLCEITDEKEIGEAIKVILPKDFENKSLTNDEVNQFFVKSLYNEETIHNMLDKQVISSLIKYVEGTEGSIGREVFLFSLSVLLSKIDEYRMILPDKETLNVLTNDEKELNSYLTLIKQENTARNLARVNKLVEYNNLFSKPLDYKEFYAKTCNVKNLKYNISKLSLLSNLFNQGEFIKEDYDEEQMEDFKLDLIALGAAEFINNYSVSYKEFTLFNDCNYSAFPELSDKLKTRIEKFYNENKYSDEISSLEEAYRFVQEKIQNTVMFKNVSQQNYKKLLRAYEKDNTRIETTNNILTAMIISNKEKLSNGEIASFNELYMNYLNNSHYNYSQNTVKKQLSLFFNCSTNSSDLLSNIYKLFNKVVEILNAQQEKLEQLDLSNLKKFAKVDNDGICRQNITDAILIDEVYSQMKDLIEYDYNDLLTSSLLLILDEQNKLKIDDKDELAIKLGFNNFEMMKQYKKTLLKQATCLSLENYFNSLSNKKNTEKNQKKKVLFNVFNKVNCCVH